MCLKCREIGKNLLSHHVALACGRCLAEHKVGEGVTWRRVALTRKRQKKQKMGESEEKLLEKMWKKKGKKGQRRRRGEKERSEGWEAQRAVSQLHDTANVVGILPAMSRPPLCGKRPCSNRLGKKNKNAGKIEKKCCKPSKVISTTSPRQCNFWQPSTKERPGTDSVRARVAQQLRKNHRKCHKTDRT